MRRSESHSACWGRGGGEEGEGGYELLAVGDLIGRLRRKANKFLVKTMGGLINNSDREKINWLEKRPI